MVIGNDVFHVISTDDDSLIQPWTSQLYSSLTRKTPEAMQTQSKQAIPSSPKGLNNYNFNRSLTIVTSPSYSGLSKIREQSSSSGLG